MSGHGGWVFRLAPGATHPAHPNPERTDPMVIHGDPEPPRDTMWETPARRVLHYRDGGWAFVDEPDDPVGQWEMGHPSHFPMKPTTMDGVTFFRTPVTPVTV